MKGRTTTPPDWNFSPKQLFTMLWWKLPQCADATGIIADGAVRSGKSISIAFGFLMWSMETFKDCIFGLCGKTIASFRRNVWNPMRQMCTSLEFTWEENISQNYVRILDKRTGHINTYYFFGGNDNRSQDLIQGITLAGLLLDEVALMPESFVNQALVRLSIDGAKAWINCNPDGPQHFVKRKLIDRAEELGYIYAHFTMDDNFTLSEERRHFYKTQFTGIFFRRYVLGEWCYASGLVMSAFNAETMVIDGLEESDYAMGFVSGDYGTTNPTAFLYIGYNERLQCFDVLDEYYYDSKVTSTYKTDAQYVEDIKAFASGRPILRAFLDPAAKSLIVALREARIFPRLESADNDVDNGIKWTNTMFSTGKLRISSRCKNLIRELQTYSYDEEKSEKEGKDVVMKVSDHACDALRYFCFSEAYGRKAMYNLVDLSQSAAFDYERERSL